MRAALEALQKADKGGGGPPPDYVPMKRSKKGGFRNPVTGAEWYPGDPHPGAPPASSDARGWGDLPARDAAVMDALKQAKGVEEVEEILAGVRHREIAAVVGANDRVVAYKLGPVLERQKFDHDRVFGVKGGSDTTVDIPNGAKALVATHNHASGTPISPSDILVAAKAGAQEVRATTWYGTWRAKLEGQLKPMSKLGFDALREAMTKSMVRANRAARDGAIAELGAGHLNHIGDGRRVQQATREFVSAYAKRFIAGVERDWSRWLLRPGGTRLRLEFHLRGDAGGGGFARSRGGADPGLVGSPAGRQHVRLRHGDAGRRPGDAGGGVQAGSLPGTAQKPSRDPGDVKKSSGVHHVPHDFDPVAVDPRERPAPTGALWRWVADHSDQGETVAKGAPMYWVRIPRHVYERLAAALEKSAGHKYLKKVPAGVDPKTGKTRYRYYYQVTDGQGHVANEDDLVKVGASFRLHDGEQEGHFHVVAVDGDQVTLKHDESGREVTMSTRELKLRLHREHARAIVDQRNKARTARMREFEQAKKTGTPQQVARARERARAAGADVEEPAAATAKKPDASRRGTDKNLGRQIHALVKEAAAADGAHAGARARRAANATLLALRFEGGRATARDRNAAERLLAGGVDGLVDGTPRQVDRERAQERIAQEEAGTVPDDAPPLTSGELEATVDLEVDDADELVVHEEVGEHVEGARRDLAGQRASRAGELKASGQVSKNEVFGRFSLTDHVGNGGTVGGWHVKAWVTRFVPQKAPKGQDDAFIEGCTLVAKSLERCKTPADVKVAIEELGDWSMKPVKMALGPEDAVALAAAAPPGHRFVGSGYDYRMGRVAYYTPTAAVALGGRFIKMLHKPSDAMRRAFSDARRLDREATDAQAYAAAHARTMGYTLDEARTLSLTVRAGGREVDGVTTGRVTGDAVADHFGGIKNIDYGNWMSNADRDQHLRDAGGALADLADLLGVSDSAVAVGGHLAIGFGSRGRGGSGAAAAHYEPGGNVINLTKFSGGGSLAHEFGHFLDHVAAGNGATATDSDSAFGSNSPGKLPPATAGAMRDLTTALERSDFARHARALDEKKKRAYWSSRHEMFARAFESWTEDTLGQGGRTSTYLVHGTRGLKATGVKVATKADPAATATAREAVTAAEKAVHEAIRVEAPVHAPKANLNAVTYWGVSDAVFEKLQHRSPKVKAAVDAYWQARRAETAAKRSGGTESAQPYPQGYERAHITGLVKNVVEAMKTDGVLERVMKAFLRRGNR